MSALITPLRVAGLVAPVLRPLPTIFTYARLTAASGGKSAQAVDDEFHASVTALAGILEALGHDVQIPEAERQDVLEKCSSLADLTGEDLAAALDGFCAELTDLHQKYGKDLRKAVAAAPEKYRDLYRQAVTPRKLLVCYTEEMENLSEGLERKIRDRCFYDYQGVEGDFASTPVGSADLIVFAPHTRPIPANLLAIAENNGLPFLILMGGDKAEDMQNMALMKSEHLYRKSGYNVLRSPFTPARLYSALDTIYLRQLGRKLLPLPKEQESAAAASQAVANEG